MADPGGGNGPGAAHEEIPMRRIQRRSFSAGSRGSSQSSLSSYHTARSNLSMSSMATGASRETQGVDEMEGIAEENDRLLNARPGRNMPFNWGAEVTNELAKLVKEEYERSKQNRRDAYKDWEETSRSRSRGRRGSNPDLANPKNDDDFFSFGNSTKKGKHENPALVQLREKKRLRLEKEKKELDLIKEKEKLYAMQK